MPILLSVPEFGKCVICLDARKWMLPLALGLTFQQLQKYEKAQNRISAGRLHQLAVEYSCPVAWFFGNYDNSGATPLTDEELDFLRLLRSCSVEGRQIAFKLLETYRSPALLKQTNAALAETR